MRVLKLNLDGVLRLGFSLLYITYILYRSIVYSVLCVTFQIGTAYLFMWILTSYFNIECLSFIVVLFILVLIAGFVYESLLYSKQNRKNIIFKPYITANLENNIFDLISQAEILNRNIISDIDSMSKFIEQLNLFQSKEKFNIVMENGNIGVDTDSDISDQIAQKWAEKVNVFNNLIHTKSHDVETHIGKLLKIESQIREDPNYSIIEHKFASSDLESRFGEARLKFKHWD